MHWYDELNKSNSKKDEVIRSTVYLSKSLHYRLKVKLLDNGLTFSRWVREQAIRFLSN